VSKPPKDAGIKVVARNKRARFNYSIEDSFEAGLVLVGSEVKALREGNANLSDSYAVPKGSELFLVNCRIGEYKPAARFQHEPTRTRKLLLHRKELDKLIGQMSERGYAIVPLSLHFRNGHAKVEIALARGKTHADRREDIKERESKREVARAMRRRR
jgi:SsrA-binding protein